MGRGQGYLADQLPIVSVVRVRAVRRGAEAGGDAVLAGCRPEYFPILLAAVEARGWNGAAFSFRSCGPTPLTGAFSAEAQDQVRAAELAVKEFNDEGE